MNKIVVISYLITFLLIFKNLIILALFLRAIMSWVTFGGHHAGNRLMDYIVSATDPFINLAKKIPHTFAMMDFSLIIAMIGIEIFVHFAVIFLTTLA